MTNYNERLDEILDRVYLFGMNGGLGYEKFENELSPKDAKQAITSLIKELVAEAKPSGWVSPKNTDDPEWQGYSSGIREFEQNLLKAFDTASLYLSKCREDRIKELNGDK